jgi:hypothetical protein
MNAAYAPGRRSDTVESMPEFADYIDHISSARHRAPDDELIDTIRP